MKDSTKKWTGWVALTVIVVAAGVALAVTNNLTQDPIAQQGAQQANETLRALFPDADGFESISADGGEAAWRVTKGGQEQGYAIVTQAQGYGGTVEVTSALAPGGTLVGIGVGGADFKETEGLGSKARESSFTDQFQQKMPPLSLGDDVDAITGATVTSRAVVNAVNDGAAKLAALTGGAAGGGAAGGEGSGAPGGATVEGRSASASVIGYAGPVLVRLTLDDSDQIGALAVGEARFMETEGVGGRVREESFAAQFIGKKPPLTLGDVDAVSGATISSQAVVDAVNEAAAFITQAR